MKALALLGSARTEGNTAAVLSGVISGMQKVAGSRLSLDLICLNRIQANPCLNCGKCYPGGKCVIADDISAIYDSLETYDILLLAAPIYFSGISAQAKTFIDRAQCKWWAYRERISHGRTECGDRRAGFISTAGSPERENLFAPSLAVVKSYYNVLGFKYAGSFLVANSDAVPPGDDPVTLEKASAFGESLMTV